ncbi:MAG: hypothetical protein JST00_19370 [Deltaproteobacteria bacterium]|nr:hypothetical protein [Deltaproteobacteria bacterium]
MRRARSSLFAVGLAMFACSTLAHAETPAPFEYDESVRPRKEPRRVASTRPPRLSLDATTGVGTPGGLLSGGASVWAGELALGGGAGLSVDGPQIYAGARIHPLSLGGADRLGIGAHWSTGSYATSASAPHRYLRSAHWLSIEASILGRWAPWDLRIVGGAAFVMNPQDSVCVAIRLGSACRHPLTWVPYVGFAVSFGVL